LNLKKRLADVEKSIPRGSATDRAALAELTDEELREVLRGGIQQNSEPTSEIGNRLRSMTPEDFEALTRGRRVIRNQIGDREN
jgi:hypothetical protein